MGGSLSGPLLYNQIFTVSMIIVSNICGNDIPPRTSGRHILCHSVHTNQQSGLATSTISYEESLSFNLFSSSVNSSSATCSSWSKIYQKSKYLACELRKLCL